MDNHELYKSNSSEESINKHNELFERYINNVPTLKDALKQMLFSAGVGYLKSERMIKEIFDRCKEHLYYKFTQISNKYKNITLEEAQIISSYTFEFNNFEDRCYSPYKILNKNLVSKERHKGIGNISKYLFILLKSLRKLDRFYTKNNLYRSINKNVDLEFDINNINKIPYQKGNIKIFWGFTSTSLDSKKTFKFLGENGYYKTGTIFSLTGNIWGYDITLFNIFNEDEILLEPERKIKIDDVLNINNVIHITCKILDSPIVLESISENLKQKRPAITNIFDFDKKFKEIKQRFNELNLDNKKNNINVNNQKNKNARDVFVENTNINNLIDDIIKNSKKLNINPAQIKSDKHKHGMILLLSNSNWKCNICSEIYKSEVSAYYCSKCNFFICSKCIGKEKKYPLKKCYHQQTKLKRFNFPCHRHIMIYCRISKSSLFETNWNCNICKKIYGNKIWSFYCTNCDYNICLSCSRRFIPEEEYIDKIGITIDDHLHSLVYMITNRDWICNLCRKKYNNNIPTYYCSKCDYDACERCMKKLSDEEKFKILPIDNKINNKLKRINILSHKHTLIYCSTSRGRNPFIWRCNKCLKKYIGIEWSFYCSVCDYDLCYKCYKEYYDEDIEDRENEQNEDNEKDDEEDDEKNDESILSEII